jgi:gamma-glutamyltranspeptidase/glutathione hydrolase
MQDVTQTARHGAVACGHPITAAAAVEILADGGNAFDAAIAAQCAACVAEPVLASLGGGGFLLAWRPGAAPELYDFFAQTPCTRRGPDSAMRPVEVDFGTARQTFHIGAAAIATPGTVAGLFAVHRALGSLPMPRLLAPAVRAAREGVVVNDFQAYVFRVVEPIFAGIQPFDTAAPGAALVQPELAASLEALGREGEALFYRGEIATRLIELCRNQGGHLSTEDLAGYRVHVRRPLEFRHRDTRVLGNPPPAAGGVLVRHSLAALAEGADPEALLNALRATDRARRSLLGHGDQVSRGTTHISVADAHGNLAAVTLSNGEGCGSSVPGTGIVPNNMLGEEDINPAGIGHWHPDRRLGSMMAPTLLLAPDRSMALGSGGSNRIRSAVAQTIARLIDLRETPAAAVAAPRLHVEAGVLSLEPGIEPGDLGPTTESIQRWDNRNLFFGGVHVVLRTEKGRFAAAGDPRRGGVARLV